MSLPEEDNNWLDSVLRAIRRTKVAVFGDFCLDAYWSIDAGESELSVETGLPVRRVRQQRYTLGGAGNIAANLAALGVGHVRAIGLIGDDLFGREMLGLLDKLNVNRGGMLSCQQDWQTLVYSKPHVRGAEQNRLDFGSFNTVAAATVDALAEQLGLAAAQSEAVILNQQVPAGVSTPEMIERVNEIVAAHPECKFIVDSRHRAELYEGGVLKLNAHEAARLLGDARPLDERIPADQVRDFASHLHQQTGQTVLVTRGENGMVVACEGVLEDIPGIQIAERTDPVGAGDTVVASFAAALACGCDATTAAKLAGIAASVTVRKLQTTGTANPEEIRRTASKPT